MAAPAAAPSVLIVDDDPDILEIVGLVLASAGYEVISASDGAEALGLLRSGMVPSVILLDVMMPSMNGWEFRAAQSEDPALAAVPVVLLTGDGNAAEKSQAFRASGYLKKPVDLAVLLETVERCRRRGGEERERGPRPS